MASLREAGNERIRAGDHAGAVARYRQALEMLESEIRSASSVSSVALVARLRGDRAPLLGNLSAAQLGLGDAGAALEAARGAAKANRSYAKAYFRQAKAMLALGRPHAAANAARLSFFMQGQVSLAGTVDTKALLKQAEELASENRLAAAAAASSSSSAFVTPDAHEAGGGAMCSLELAPELPSLVVRFLDGAALVRLGRGARRFWVTLATEEALLACAAQCCPGGSERWLRKDLLRAGTGAGWLYAARALAACPESASAAPNGRLAICDRGGQVFVCQPVEGGGRRAPLWAPPHCLPFSLCWGPSGEYLAYTSVSEARLAALVVAPMPWVGTDAIVTPLQMAPYYLAPSPCGTRIAVLGALRTRQVLCIVDTAQATMPCTERAPPMSLHLLVSAAPLYFDWAPHAPELLLALHGRRLCRERGAVASEAYSSVGEATACEAAFQQPLQQPTTELAPRGGAEVGAEGWTVSGSASFRAPQWVDRLGCPQGAWLAPKDSDAGNGRVSLVMHDPASGTTEVICETLPPSVHFSASPTGRWVAWSGMHDMRGHGGVFVRRLPVASGSPIMVFNGTALALAWGGDRLALLIELGDSDELVWAVWDPPVEGVEGGPAGVAASAGRLSVAPASFRPNEAFSELVVPFFDQFERRLRLWSPRSDAIVFADERAQVWVQPFPPPGRGPGGLNHPLADLVGAAGHASAAPPAFRVADGSFACWSPQ